MQKMSNAYDEEGEEEDVGDDNQPPIDQRGYAASPKKQADHTRDECRLGDSPLARQAKLPQAKHEHFTSTTRHIPRASPSPPPPATSSQRSVQRIERQRGRSRVRRSLPDTKTSHEEVPRTPSPPQRKKNQRHERSSDSRNETQHHEEDQRIPSPPERSRKQREISRDRRNKQYDENQHTPSPPQKLRKPKDRQRESSRARRYSPENQQYEEEKCTPSPSPPERSRKQQNHQHKRSPEPSYEDEEQRTPSPPHKSRKQRNRQRERSPEASYDEEQRTPSPPQRPRKQRNRQRERSPETYYDEEQRTPTPPQRSRRKDHNRGRSRESQESLSYETSSSYDSSSSYEDPTPPPPPPKMDPRKKKKAVMPIEHETNEFAKKGLPSVPSHVVPSNRIVPESTVKIFSEKLPNFNTSSSGYGSKPKNAVSGQRGSQFSVPPQRYKPRREVATVSQPRSQIELRPLIAPPRGVPPQAYITETVSEAYMQKRMAIKGVLKPTQVHKDVLRFSDPTVRPRGLGKASQLPSEVVMCDWELQRQQRLEKTTRRVTSTNTVKLPRIMQPRPPPSSPPQGRQFESKIPRLPQIATTVVQPQPISRIPQPQPPKLPRINAAPPQRRYGAGASNGVYATSRNY